MIDAERIKVDAWLDLANYSCPMPLLKTKKALNIMTAGEVLEVYSTDPISIHDIPLWCKLAGHRLLASKEEVSGCRYYIQKMDEMMMHPGNDQR